MSTSILPPPSSHPSSSRSMISNDFASLSIGSHSPPPSLPHLSCPPLATGRSPLQFQFEPANSHAPTTYQHRTSETPIKSKKQHHNHHHHHSSVDSDSSIASASASVSLAASSATVQPIMQTEDSTSVSSRPDIPTPVLTPTPPPAYFNSNKKTNSPRRTPLMLSPSCQQLETSSHSSVLNGGDDDVCDDVDYHDDGVDEDVPDADCDEDDADDDMEDDGPDSLHLDRQPFNCGDDDDTVDIDDSPTDTDDEDLLISVGVLPDTEDDFTLALPTPLPGSEPNDLTSTEDEKEAERVDELKYQRFLNWMRQHGATFPNLVLKRYAKNYRGVHIHALQARPIVTAAAAATAATAAASPNSRHSKSHEEEKFISSTLLPLPSLPTTDADACHIGVDKSTSIDLDLDLDLASKSASSPSLSPPSPATRVEMIPTTVSKGTTLLSIPHHLLITVELARASPLGSAIQHLQNLGSQAILAVYLIHENFKQRCWEEYEKEKEKRLRLQREDDERRRASKLKDEAAAAASMEHFNCRSHEEEKHPSTSMPLKSDLTSDLLIDPTVLTPTSSRIGAPLPPSPSSHPSPRSRTPNAHDADLETDADTTTSNKKKSTPTIDSTCSYFSSPSVLASPSPVPSFWHPWLSVLPSSFHTLPMFFAAPETAMLNGCTELLLKVASQKKSMREEYTAIKGLLKKILARQLRAARHDSVDPSAPPPSSSMLIPYFDLFLREFSYRTFVWGCLAVGTRVFSLQINGVKTSVLAPLADMANHPPKNGAIDPTTGHPYGSGTNWTYDARKQAFTLTSCMELAHGEPVYESYGVKCNKRFFCSYGFCLEENTANEVTLLIPTNEFGLPCENEVDRETDAGVHDLDSATGPYGASLAPMSRSFLLHGQYDHLTEELLNFLRIASCYAEQLAEAEAEEEAQAQAEEQLRQQLLDQHSRTNSLAGSHEQPSPLTDEDLRALLHQRLLYTHAQSSVELGDVPYRPNRFTSPCEPPVPSRTRSSYERHARPSHHFLSSSSNPSGPISLENELAALYSLRQFARRGLEAYDTTLEQDASELDALPEVSSTLRMVNQRNALLFRMGEKKILHYYIDFATLGIALLCCPWEVHPSSNDDDRESRDLPFDVALDDASISSKGKIRALFETGAIECVLAPFVSKLNSHATRLDSTPPSAAASSDTRATNHSTLRSSEEHKREITDENEISASAIPPSTRKVDSPPTSASSRLDADADADADGDGDGDGDLNFFAHSLSCPSSLSLLVQDLSTSSSLRANGIGVDGSHVNMNGVMTYLTTVIVPLHQHRYREMVKQRRKKQSHVTQMKQRREVAVGTHIERYQDGSEAYPSDEYSYAYGDSHRFVSFDDADDHADFYHHHHLDPYSIHPPDEDDDLDDEEDPRGHARFSRAQADAYYASQHSDGDGEDVEDDDGRYRDYGEEDDGVHNYGSLSPSLEDDADDDNASSHRRRRIHQLNHLLAGDEEEHDDGEDQPSCADRAFDPTSQSQSQSQSRCSFVRTVSTDSVAGGGNAGDNARRLHSASRSRSDSHSHSQSRPISRSTSLSRAAFLNYASHELQRERVRSATSTLTNANGNGNSRGVSRASQRSEREDSIRRESDTDEEEDGHGELYAAHETMIRQPPPVAASKSDATRMKSAGRRPVSSNSAATTPTSASITAPSKGTKSSAPTKVQSNASATSSAASSAPSSKSTTVVRSSSVASANSSVSKPSKSSVSAQRSPLTVYHDASSNASPSMMTVNKNNRLHSSQAQAHSANSYQPPILSSSSLAMARSTGTNASTTVSTTATKSKKILNATVPSSFLQAQRRSLSNSIASSSDTLPRLNTSSSVSSSMTANSNSASTSTPTSTSTSHGNGLNRTVPVVHFRSSPASATSTPTTMASSTATHSPSLSASSTISMNNNGSSNLTSSAFSVHHSPSHHPHAHILNQHSHAAVLHLTPSPPPSILSSPSSRLLPTVTPPSPSRLGYSSSATATSTTAASMLHTPTKKTSNGRVSSASLPSPTSYQTANSNSPRLPHVAPQAMSQNGGNSQTPNSSVTTKFPHVSPTKKSHHAMLNTTTRLATYSSHQPMSYHMSVRDG